MHTQIRIVFIGAGNLATQLAQAFQLNGHIISQIYSRTKESAQTLATLCNTEFTTDLANIRDDADLYVYAVKDTALSEILSSIKIKNGLHVHTAGSMLISVFEGLQNNYGVFYPFQTLSKQRLVDFTHIPILIEANTEANTFLLEKAAKLLSKNVIRCSSEQRKAVHLSGVFACNFTNHMYAIAAKILTEANMPFEILQALIDETSAKTHQLNPLEAQTGPAIRYDRNVIDKHLEALKEMPAEYNLYEAISKNIHEYGKQNS